MMTLNMVIMMIFITTILSYYINSTIPLDKQYITNNYHKLYMSIFMGIQMGILELLFIFSMSHKTDITKNHIILFICLIIILLYIGYKLYSLDFLQDDKQFMLAMIEHHGLAIAMTNKSKNKSKNNKTNPKLQTIKHNIIKSQTEEIKQFKNLLQI